MNTRTKNRHLRQEVSVFGMIEVREPTTSRCEARSIRRRLFARSAKKVVGSNPVSRTSVVASFISLATTFFMPCIKKSSRAYSAAPPFENKTARALHASSTTSALRCAGFCFRSTADMDMRSKKARVSVLFCFGGAPSAPRSASLKWSSQASYRLRRFFSFLPQRSQLVRREGIHLVAELAADGHVLSLGDDALQLLGPDAADRLLHALA